MNSNKLLLGTCTLALVAGGAFYAYAEFAEKPNQYADSFCEDLENPKAYDKHNAAHHQMLIPGQGEWVFRTDNDFRTDWNASEKTLRYLQNMQAAMKEHNAELIVAIPPTRGLVHSDQISQEYLEKYGMTNTDAIWKDYANMLQKMKNAGINVVGATQKQARGDDFYYKRNHHWTAEGAKIIAQNVADTAKTLPNYSKIPAKEFETTENGEENYDSSYDNVFEDICGTELPAEPAQKFQTRPVNAANNENALFENGEKPQVVLLGTSNSKLGSSHANFEGFLKEYMQRDIFNHAFIGAGIDTSLMSYLNSEHYNSDQPKIVIWEVPGYYNFNIMDDKIFNQAIPAALGQCESQKVAQTKVSNLQPSQMKKLFHPTRHERQKKNGQEDTNNAQKSATQLQRIRQNGQGYMHIRFSEPVSEDFDIEFIYEDGGRKIQQFSRASRYPFDRNFYTLLPKDKNIKNLEVIGMSLSKKFHKGVDAKVSICPMSFASREET